MHDCIMCWWNQYKTAGAMNECIEKHRDAQLTKKRVYPGVIASHSSQRQQMARHSSHHARDTCHRFQEDYASDHE